MRSVTEVYLTSEVEVSCRRIRSRSSSDIELPGGRRMYINRGIGHLLRVRINARPEVTLFELTKA